MSIEQVIQIISTQNPVSIFLYGSRTRDDFLPESDYEVWVIFEESNYVSRGSLKELVNDSNFSIYPFKYNEIVNYELDTPFQKKIYMNDLILSWKTISWKKVIENLKAPKIMVLDLIQDIRFYIWCSLSAMISDRNWDKKTAKNQFYKSCLFGTRNLIILKEKTFPIWYKKIFEYSKKIDLWEFGELVNNAFGVRENRIEYDWNNLFKNIKYLNKYIETEIMNEYQRNWNIVLIDN